MTCIDCRYSTQECGDCQAERRIAVEEASPPSTEPDELHVVPMSDRVHETTTSCWCKPKRDEKDARIVVHRVLS